MARKARLTFGEIEGRSTKGGEVYFRARYLAPDGRMNPKTGRVVRFSRAFHVNDADKRQSKAFAEAQAYERARAWLAEQHGLIQADKWQSPDEQRETKVAEARAIEAAQAPTFEEYARQWVETRKGRNGRPLAPRTKDHYLALLDAYLVPVFGPMRLDAIEPAQVNIWFDAFTITRTRKGHTGETTRAHTYAFARSVMNTATGAHGPIVGKVNPFAVRGGGSSPSTKRTELATSEQVETILETIRPEWRLIVLLGLWTGLRYSEIAELRRSDIDLEKRLIYVRRSVSRSKGSGVHAKGPKSEAGNRDMHLPDVVFEPLKQHLRSRVTGRDGLLFAGANGQHLAPSTFYGKLTCQTCKKAHDVCEREQRKRNASPHTFEPRENGWYSARYVAGCPELHFHDLRATGATLMAQLGATEAEIQAFLGDSTPQAAQRYVRAAQSRMKQHAERMNQLAEGGQW